MLLLQAVNATLHDHALGSSRVLKFSPPITGINLTKRELLELIAESDRDGTGDIGYDEFLEIMTETLQKFREAKREEAEEKSHQVRGQSF